jgi:outer membrane protein assembly factor BamA
VNSSVVFLEERTAMHVVAAAHTTERDVSDEENFTVGHRSPFRGFDGGELRPNKQSRSIAQRSQEPSRLTDNDAYIAKPRLSGRQ